jgi:hypothetical protein
MNEQSKGRARRRPIRSVSASPAGTSWTSIRSRPASSSRTASSSEGHRRPAGGHRSRDHRTIVIVCKGSIDESNTWNDQGGIARPSAGGQVRGPRGPTPSAPAAGSPIRRSSSRSFRQGPELVRQLQEWGPDSTGERPDRHTLEGGHSHARVLHAHGDETGRAIAEALIAKVRSKSNIRVIENFFTIDCSPTDAQRCSGQGEPLHRIIGHSEDHGLQMSGRQYHSRHRRARPALPRNDDRRSPRRMGGDGLPGRGGLRDLGSCSPSDDAVHRGRIAP